MHKYNKYISVASFQLCTYLVSEYICEHTADKSTCIQFFRFLPPLKKEKKVMAKF